MNRKWKVYFCGCKSSQMCPKEVGFFIGKYYPKKKHKTLLLKKQMPKTTRAGCFFGTHGFVQTCPPTSLLKNPWAGLWFHRTDENKLTTIYVHILSLSFTYPKSSSQLQYSPPQPSPIFIHGFSCSSPVRATPTRGFEPGCGKFDGDIGRPIGAFPRQKGRQKAGEKIAGSRRRRIRRGPLRDEGFSWFDLALREEKKERFW